MNDVSTSEALTARLGARTGHFRLESGYHGNLWLADLDDLFRRPRALSPQVAELARLISAYDVDGVCGPLTGGAFLAALVARDLDLDFWWTQRTRPPDAGSLYSAEYHLPPGTRLEGRRVAIVDDVVNAGSAVRATQDSVLAAGGSPVVVGALLTLGPSAEPPAVLSGLPVERLAHAHSELWDPATCPKCADGSPLTDPEAAPSS